MLAVAASHDALSTATVAPFQPSKVEESYRNYEDSNPLFDRVKQTYYLMHTNQSVASVKAKHEEWLKFDHAKKTIMEVTEMLDDLVDESDPDVDFPNSFHAYQTAERIRQVYPDEEWLQLTGFIHDLGKLMSLYGEPQFSTVGDTFPVGCAPSPKCVFGSESFRDNEDFNHEVYSTKLGMYQENCGIDNLLMSWGHDEYLYNVLKNAQQCTLPKIGLQIIRFHSFYPWHTGNDYMHFMAAGDENILDWVRQFNKFDLYSKDETLPDVEALKPYYQSLIDKFLPGKIDW